MQLPKHLQHFSEPTLIVLADHVHAQFWLVHLETLEELDQLVTPHEQKSDREGAFVNGDHGGSRSGTEPNDDERLHHFVHLMKEKIETLCRTKNIKRIDTIMRPDLAHALRAKLAHDITPFIHKELGVDLMKEHILESLDRLLRG
ncbi:hypothetical protein EXS71_00375 [Candidatus Uhrbacteria bacterium]|nr:hypothetical protein [Candidatus Uhrbacteria bacterium]